MSNNSITLTDSDLARGAFRIGVLIVVFVLAMQSGIAWGWAFLAANGFLFFFNIIAHSIYKEMHK